MMRNVHRNWLRCVGIGLNPSLGISQRFKSDRNMRILTHTHAHLNKGFSYFFLRLLYHRLCTVVVSIQFCWQTTICLSSTRFVGWLGWPASTNASATPVVTTLTLWPPTRAPSSRGHSQPAYMAISQTPSLCVCGLHSPMWPHLWPPMKWQEDRPGAFVSGRPVNREDSHRAKMVWAENFRLPWAQTYLWVDPPSMCRLWLDLALSTCPPFVSGGRPTQSWSGVKIDSNSHPPQVGL